MCVCVCFWVHFSTYQHPPTRHFVFLQLKPIAPRGLAPPFPLPHTQPTTVPDHVNEILIFPSHICLWCRVAPGSSVGGSKGSANQGGGTDHPRGFPKRHGRTGGVGSTAGGHPGFYDGGPHAAATAGGSPGTRTGGSGSARGCGATGLQRSRCRRWRWRWGWRPPG